MGLSDLVAVLLFAGVIAYALFGGADFGCGFWDLTAGDADRGADLRHQIDRSIGPVWEANHVWLVFVLVYLWTAFPEAFAAVATALFAPLVGAAAGIVFRGGAFVFRKSASTLGQARFFGVLFASSSVLTPFFLGAAVGAVASGRVPARIRSRTTCFSTWSQASSKAPNSTAPCACGSGINALLARSRTAATASLRACLPAVSSAAFKSS